VALFVAPAIAVAGLTVQASSSAQPHAGPDAAASSAPRGALPASDADIARRSKVVLKEAFSDLLPPAIRRRPKMGFGVPLDRWFRGPLQGELRAVLLDPSTAARGLFRPEAVGRLVEEHVSGSRDHAYKLWSLLMLELWQRRYLD